MAGRGIPEVVRAEQLEGAMREIMIECYEAMNEAKESGRQNVSHGTHTSDGYQDALERGRVNGLLQSLEIIRRHCNGGAEEAAPWLSGSG